MGTKAEKIKKIKTPLCFLDQVIIQLYEFKLFKPLPKENYFHENVNTFVTDPDRGRGEWGF